MGRHIKASDIPVTVITATMNAEPSAIAYILQHYRNYIRKLATRILKDEYGNEYYYVDEETSSHCRNYYVLLRERICRARQQMYRYCC